MEDLYSMGYPDTEVQKATSNAATWIKDGKSTFKCWGFTYANKSTSGPISVVIRDHTMANKFEFYVPASKAIPGVITFPQPVKMTGLYASCNATTICYFVLSDIITRGA